jgi:hypothetical protein
VLTQAAAIERTGAELAAAKAGLVTKTLEIEKLKVQIARLKRVTFGTSSERVSRELEQLELKLEELETAEAEREAALETEAAAEEPGPEDVSGEESFNRLYNLTNPLAPNLRPLLNVAPTQDVGVIVPAPTRRCDGVSCRFGRKT